MKSPELKNLLYATFGHLTDEQLLALTIYGEARGESGAGKLAVGSVILERVAHRDWDGKTVKEVCLMPHQFSCFLPDDPNFPQLKEIACNIIQSKTNNNLFRICCTYAAGLLSGAIAENDAIKKANCCQYLTSTAKDTVNWWKKLQFVTKVGNHEFYA